MLSIKANWIVPLHWRFELHLFFSFYIFNFKKYEYPCATILQLITLSQIIHVLILLCDLFKMTLYLAMTNGSQLDVFFFPSHNVQLSWVQTSLLQKQEIVFKQNKRIIWAYSLMKRIRSAFNVVETKCG